MYKSEMSGQGASLASSPIVTPCKTYIWAQAVSEANHKRIASLIVCKIGELAYRLPGY